MYGGDAGLGSSAGETAVHVGARRSSVRPGEHLGEDRPRATRGAVGGALLVPALLLEYHANLGNVFAGVLAFVVVASVHGRRYFRGLVPRVAAQLLVFGSALGIFVLQAQSGAIRPTLGQYVAVGAVAAAAPRLFFTFRAKGHMVTLALGLLGLMGLARLADRPTYGLAVAIYLSASVVALTAADRAWPPLLRYPRGVFVPFALGLTIAGSVMALLGWALPAAEPVVTAALRPYLSDDGTARSGFGSGEVRLGKMTEILESREVVMRIVTEPGSASGGAVDHLRGQVYARYRAGRWLTQSRAGSTPTETGRFSLGRGEAQTTVTIESERGMGRSLFTPLQALELTGAPLGTTLDERGILMVPSDQAGERRAYTVGLGRSTQPMEIDLPSEPDLAIPRRIAPRIRAMAGAWTADRSDDAGRLDALVRRFARDFEYSTTLEVPPVGRDPVLHFLEHAHTGHCELFASATTLLARALGIPARLVGGYRVFEYNRVGGYHIVRQQDAHAWVEVFVGGQWRTLDPTPSGALPGERRLSTPWIAARWDVIRRSLAQAWSRLEELTAIEVLGAMAAVGALFLVWICLRIGTRTQRAARSHRSTGRFQPLVRLEAWVAATRMLYRPPSRTLGAFAGDLRLIGLERAACLVEACSALRYGAEGDDESLGNAVERYVAQPDGRGESSDAGCVGAPPEAPAKGRAHEASSHAKPLRWDPTPVCRSDRPELPAEPSQSGL